MSLFLIVISVLLYCTIQSETPLFCDIYYNTYIYYSSYLDVHVHRGWKGKGGSMTVYSGDSDPGRKIGAKVRETQRVCETVTVTKKEEWKRQK